MKTYENTCIKIRFCYTKKALPVRERRCDVQMTIALFVVTIIICPVLTGHERYTESNEKCDGVCTSKTPTAVQSFVGVFFLSLRERRCDVQMTIALFVVTIIICPVLTGIIANYLYAFLV
jgi:dolichol kinase